MPTLRPDDGGNAGAGLPDMAQSYDAYFRSGLYHRRYPRPNRRTLRLLRQRLGAGGRMLDFGAGEGRYALAVATADAAHVLAVDVSPVARELLSRDVKRRGLSETIAIADTSDAAYRDQAIGSRSFDVAMLGFGVLGHIAGRKARLAVLHEVRSCLKPTGSLVLGLPNAARRFRTEQAISAHRALDGTLEPGDILYERHAEGGTIALFYHLFTGEEIVADLKEAGFAIETFTSESIFPERAVITSPVLSVVDDVLCDLLPPRWSYGYLVLGRPA